MFDTLLQYFQGTPWSLWGPFGLLLLCGLGLPLPEDIVLIVAGALGAIDERSWVQVAVVMYTGVLLGDTMIFFAGHHVGARLLASSWLQRILPPTKQAKVEAMLKRYGSWAIFLGRFLPGLRAPLFFTAGSLRVTYLRFLLLDGAAALVSAPVFVWVGRWLWVEFQDNLEDLNEALARTHTYSQSFAVGLVAVLLLSGWIVLRRARRVG